MAAILSCRALSKFFGGVCALRDVSLSIPSGAVTSVAGENGSGKSTLVKLCAGVLRPESGSITVGGVPRRYLTPHQAVQLGIQVIYQDLCLFPNLTVAENLALNTLLEERRTFISWRHVREIARSALERIGVAVELDRPTGDLSQSEKQLVAIARALLRGARIIIMDEPTSALPHSDVRSLFRVIEDLRKRNLAVLFVSHKLDEILAISDRIVVLREGRKVTEGERESFDRYTLSSAMIGAAVAEESPPTESVRSQIALAVENLTRSPLYCNVSFAVRKGEIVGLAGLRGAGRTALALGIFGLLKPEEGTLRVEGQPLRIFSPAHALRAGIAYVPEDRLTEGLFLTRSVATNIGAASFRRLAGIVGYLPRRRLMEEGTRWVRSLGIRTPAATYPVEALSGGNQQKTLLARWLATRARVLLLNRPTVGIDIGAKQEVHRTIRRLAGEGRALVIISDDLAELASLCHRIVVLHRGRSAGVYPGGNEEALCKALDSLT